MRRALAAWNRFWFAPEPVSSLAVFRIAYALVALAWTATILPDVGAFYGGESIVPTRPGDPWTWSVLDLAPSAAAALAAVMLVACVTLLAGAFTRTSALVLLVGLISLQRTNPFVHNSGDVLLRVLALMLVLAPAGEALSVDAWRRRGREGFWLLPLRAPWALRLIQLQLCVLYASTVWAKMRGTTWNDGTAVSYALRLGDLARFPLPASVENSVFWANAFTFGTLAIEVALAFLVWNRRARPWVLGAGVVMHLSIEYSLLVGFFSWTLIVAYLAWVPADTMSRWILRARARRPTEATT